MKYKNKNEEFFKSIASEYVKQDGERLKREFAELEKNNENISLNIDRKLDKALQRNKTKKLFYYVASVAACFLIVISSVNLFSTQTQNYNNSITTKETAHDIILLSSKLPQGYSIVKTDYDNGKTIYTIENQANNNIVLTVENKMGNINTSNMRNLVINGMQVYAHIKRDYNFITFEKDNLIYTLTDKYNYHDLINLSKSLL